MNKNEVFVVLRIPAVVGLIVAFTWYDHISDITPYSPGTGEYVGYVAARANGFKNIDQSVNPIQTWWVLQGLWWGVRGT